MLSSVGFKTPDDIQADLRHPLAMNSTDKPATYFIQYPSGSVSQIREQDNEPSGLTANAPVPCALLCGALSLRLVIHLSYLFNTGIHTMIYTFLITNKNKLADLDNTRKVSVCADTEQQARQALNGLPLLFVSQTPTARAI